MESGSEYDVCPTETGIAGSYTYVYDNEVVPGWEEATCYYPTVATNTAPVCVGYWYEGSGEPGGDGLFGVFMNVVAESGSGSGVLYDTWWGGLLDDVDYAANRANGDEHGVELEVMTGVSDDGSCGNYSSM